jgi:hypothetical protein
MEDEVREEASPSIESRSRRTRKAVAKRTMLSSSAEPSSARASRDSSPCVASMSMHKDKVCIQKSFFFP